jgi:hypothetical protein
MPAGRVLPFLADNLQLGLLAAAVAIGGLLAVLALTALLARAHRRTDQPEFVRRIGRMEAPPPTRRRRMPALPEAVQPYALGLCAIALVVLGVVAARVIDSDDASSDDAEAAILDIPSPTADLSGFIPPTPTPDLSAFMVGPGTPTPDLSGFITPSPTEQRCRPEQRAQARC